MTDNNTRSFECYGCDHHECEPDEYGDCYKYCDPCIDEMGDCADASRAEWEVWRSVEAVYEIDWAAQWGPGELPRWPSSTPDEWLEELRKETPDD